MKSFPRISAASLALAFVVGCAPTDPPQALDSAAEQGISGQSKISASGDLGSGPFAVVQEVSESLPDHVVYRPENLGGLGEGSLGVLIWGNGGCSADAASARLHLLEIASHGYVAIAPGEIRSGPGAVERQREERTPTQGQFPPVETLPEDLLQGLDWILAENARAQSKFYGRIDPDAVAVAGHSCGGLQAIKVAADKRIATAIVHNSGVLNPGTRNPITGFGVAKSELENLHAPVLYILGGESDIAYPNGMDDYARITGVPAAVANLDVGHGGTYDEPYGGRAAQVAVKWLEWQLRADETSGAWFRGADCVLCASSDWSYEAKGF